MNAANSDLIEGAFRCVAMTDLTGRGSPNRRRAVARIVFWNVAVMVAFVALPMLV